MKRANKAEQASHTFLGLDLLRGGAALLVLLGHMRNDSFVEFGALPADDKNIFVMAFYAITRIGHEAVMVFFVLSGLLVGGRIIERVTNGTFNLRAYFIDRVTRILVPLVPACILTAVIATTVFGKDVRLFDVVLNAIGLNGVLVDTLQLNPPLWSLAYEIWFYILGGAVGALIINNNRAFSWVFAAACILVFTELEAKYLHFWFLGALVVYFPRHFQHVFYFFTGAGLAILGVISHQLARNSNAFAHASYFSSSGAEFILCVGVALMLPFLCQNKVGDLLKRVSKPIKFLSATSYTLYLFHYPIIKVLNLKFVMMDSINISSLSLFLLKTLITIIVCAGIYFLFERNTAWFRHRLKSLPVFRAT